MIPVHDDNLGIADQSRDEAGSVPKIDPFLELQYSYEPLTSKPTIRLLLLLPDEKGTGRLQGQLRSVPLDNPGPYDALSYTWGSPDKLLSIEIEGYCLPITESAHQLLKRIRSSETAVTVWIDSICINQNDNDEKSLQVAAMGTIYASATRVLCWLGEDSSGDAASTFDLIHTVAKADFTILEDDLLTYDFMEYNGLPKSREPQWFAAARFFRRPWFRRQWVVQEVVLGADTIIMCGNSEAHWLSLVQGLNLIVQHSMIQWGAGLPGSEDSSAELYGPLDTPEEAKGIMTFQMMMVLKLYRTPCGDLTDAIQSMMNRDQTTLAHRVSVLAALERETRVDVLSAALLRLAGHSDTSVIRAYMAMLGAMGVSVSAESINQHSDLSELASLFPCCVCTDPRDRFYAFLSLSKEKNEPGLQPDYSESTRSTYIRFTKHALLSPSDPEADTGLPLIEAGIARHGPTLSLPSWICDYTHAPHIKLLTGPGRRGIHKASGDARRDFKVANDVSELAVAAGFVDVVSRIVAQPSYPPKAEDEWREFLKSLDEMTILRGTPYPYVKPDETWLSVQWRTLIGNGDISCLAEPDEAYEESYIDDRAKFQMFATDLETWREIEETSDKVLSLDWGVRWSLLSKRCSLCETEGGLIGLVPNGAKVGDSLWIILGENMPFLLRQKSEACNKYEIFGSCYVHGIMSGEAMKAASWKEEEIVLV